MPLSDILTGTGPQGTQFPSVPPQQQEAINQFLKMSQQGLQGTNLNFDAIADQITKQHREEIVPSIAERFAGRGTLQGSGFQQQLAKSGVDLGERLAAMKAQFEMNKFGQFQGLARLGLSPQFQNVFSEGQPGLQQYIGSGLSQGAGKVASTIPGYLASRFGKLLGIGVNKDKTAVGSLSPQVTNTQSAPGSARAAVAALGAGSVPQFSTGLGSLAAAGKGVLSTGLGAGLGVAGAAGGAAIGLGLLAKKLLKRRSKKRRMRQGR